MKPSSVLPVAILALACIMLLWSAGADGTDAGYGLETEDVTTCTITYETDGGTLPWDAPGFYVAGCYMTLPTPEKDGRVFAGWYADSDLTRPVGAILATDTGDVALYAKWIEGAEAGTGWIMEASGKVGYGDNTYTISGTVEYGYDAESGGALLLRTETTVTFTGTSDGLTSEGVSYAWISSITDGWTCTGNETVDGETLTVWTYGNYTIWVRDMTVIVRMTVPYGIGSYTLTLVGTTGYEAGGTFVPDVTAEYPVAVSGVEEIEYDGSITLTASGDSFAGWYLNGELVSTSPTCTFIRLSPSDSLVAATSVLYTVVEDGEGIASLGFGDATVTDSEGNEANLSDLKPGAYTCVLEGEVTVTAEFVVEDSRTLSIEWEYGGETYSYTTTILYSDVLRFDAENPDLYRWNRNILSSVERLCTWYDGYPIDIASTLRELGSGLDEVEFAEFVLKFVQAVPYISDIDSRGCSDYWKTPLETLWDDGGDCEDLSVLYATLMGMLGYRTAFVQFEGHAMAAVTIDIEGWTVTADGYVFVLCETTGTGFSIGETSEGHLPSDATGVRRLECFPADFHL